MEEFIKRLSIETPWSYTESKSIVQMINIIVGHIETAKIIYEHDGLEALVIYINQLKLGAIY